MTANHAHDENPQGTPRKGNSAASAWLVRILMFALLAVGGYYVIAEHGAHLLAAWPLLFLLACPLMHMFHGGHGGHGGHQRSTDGDNTGARNG